jgi:GrpB-like predicted nucleotidyltransferase (UPF0157 family)
VKDAPIEIVDHDPKWSEEFLRGREIIAAALAEWLAGLPEHVGSTAVPGLAAKPIIDIMAPVRSLEAAAPAIQHAGSIGYIYFPYKVEAMHWFCKPSPAVRTHHLYLVEKGSSVWAERVAFRDALRASSELKSQYERLKRALAVRHRNDREAYTDGKALFIAGVLGRQ